MKLHPINRAKGDNRWCGPAVISFLTGRSTSEAATVIRAVGGAARVKGTTYREMVGALAEFGITAKPIELDSVSATRPTLARLHRHLRTTGQLAGEAVVLVVAGWHWQLVTARRYACGRIGEIVSIRDPRVKRRARVARAYSLAAERIEEPAALVQARDQSRRQQAHVRSQAKSRAKCRAAERDGVISIEIEQMTGYRNIIVWPGASWPRDEHGAVIDDPCEGDHYCSDWVEAEWKLDAYLQARSNR